MRLLFLSLVAAALTFGQTYSGALKSGTSTVQGQFLDSVKVKNLPAISPAPWIADKTKFTGGILVNDGLTANDCTAGGGTNYVFCFSDGNSWHSVGATQAANALNPVTQSTLLSYRAARGATLTGLSDTKVLFVGDSVTWGAFSSGYASNLPIQGSYPYNLASLVATSLGSHSSTGFVSSQAVSSTADARVTVSGGWTIGSTNGGFVYDYTTTASGNLVFTPNDGNTYDSFDVYYQNHFSDGGSFSATATGGSTTTQPTGTDSSIHKITVVAASSSTSNAVTIAQVSGKIYGIVAIEAFNSAVPRFRFANAGVGGSNAFNWSQGQASTPSGAIGAIKAYAPNLTVIMLGINDAGDSETAATFSSYYSPIITAALTTGSVIIATFPPSSGSPYTIFEPTYQPVFTSLSVSNNIPLCDIWTRFNSTFQTTLMTNALHPNPQGYQDMAASMLSFFIN